ncbi:protein AUXIN SIGNALING F-BOX 2 [Selaginella moellendorffii]|nr:protein AUXIN SIGNALING F-BOX 2 [Selaginella moellendorffii]|eukprot:XP_002982385.2 protein AUXIN SIGNALING F-BOX 2 [Selaginella moellendorffii]
MRGFARDMVYEFPDDILEHVLVFLSSHRDRNSVSLVCKSWYKAEAASRANLFIGNCYSVSPELVARRFPKVRSLTLKGKPRFADFNLLPPHWGAYLLPWIVTFAHASLPLEELRLKRMCVSDEALDLLATSFPSFRVIVLNNCDGFSTKGLASIARNCRNLQELNLQESLVEDHSGVDWISAFPDTTTSLLALHFSCLDAAVDFDALDALVARNPQLRSLGLNKKVALWQLQKLLQRCGPQLTDLGTGSMSGIGNLNGGGAVGVGGLPLPLPQQLQAQMQVQVQVQPQPAPEQQEMIQWERIQDLSACLASCTKLQSLSGIWEAEPPCLIALYPVCLNLLSLNLSYANLRNADLLQLLSHCHKLQRLWLQDNVEDAGLRTVANTCKDLRELRVFPADHEGVGVVTEQGLLAISEGCANLSSILYFCRRMTNSAITAMSRACSKMRRFRLCIITTRQPDHVTGEPLDEGFGAIVKNCKDLKRLAVSGLLTDRAFQYIGEFGKNVETLSVAFAADSDVGLEAVFRGCTKIRKLEIRDCPFGDRALLAGLERYETMRFLWLSGCRVSIAGCDELSKKLPWLNVELVKESTEDEYTVDMLYVYRTVMASARSDRPPSVIGLRGGEYFWRWVRGAAVGTSNSSI